MATKAVDGPVERLLGALREAGFEVEAVRSGRGWMLLLTELGAERPRESYLLRFFLLSGAAGEAESGSLNAEVQWGEPLEEGRPLSLGYAPDLDLLAGWPAYDAGLPWKRTLFPVPHRALREAERTGWAEPLTSSAAYVFRPEEIAGFLELHRSVSEGRETVQPGGRWMEESALGLAANVLVTGSLFSKPLFDEDARDVETGLSPRNRPGEPLRRSLEPTAEYLFWFGIGAGLPGSIEEKPAPPPSGLPEGARLSVALFAFEDGMELVGPSRGELELFGDGSARVAEPAVRPGDDRDLLRRVLFFRVKAPEESGLKDFRCNLYFGATLLQSRLVSCVVGEEQLELGPPAFSKLDYALASLIETTVLKTIPRHDLSLTVNGGQAPTATHEVRFFGVGERELEGSASLPAGSIKKAISVARGQLRKVSWNTKKEWTKGDKYRYENLPVDPDVFQQDLIDLAIKGARLYANLVSGLSVDIGGREALERVTRAPARIQISSVEDGMYLPAGLLYDHPIVRTPGAKSRAEMQVCKAFLAAAKSSEPLEDAACLQGNCPCHGEKLVICPGGFWGFRHEVGWPLGDEFGKPPVREIRIDGQGPTMTIGVSTDPDLKLRATHIPKVLALGSGEVANSLEEFAELAVSGSSHLVYFYCHGGYADPEPFLELGPLESDGLDRGFLQEERIRWGEPPPRPLVFINGCHTSRLDPESLGGLLDGFVKDANAMGVIGTEITVFENLATVFGLRVLENFLDGSMTIGAAVRRARLELLRERNPLGLVYVPFIAADTRMVSSSSKDGASD